MSLLIWTEFAILTWSSLRQLSLQVVALLLQRFDVAPLAEEEVGDCRLPNNQDAGQQGNTCHLIGPGGAATGEQEAKEGVEVEKETSNTFNLEDLLDIYILELNQEEILKEETRRDMKKKSLMWRGLGVHNHQPF